MLEAVLLHKLHERLWPAERAVHRGPVSLNDRCVISPRVHSVSDRPATSRQATLTTTVPAGSAATSTPPVRIAKVYRHQRRTAR